MWEKAESKTRLAFLWFYFWLFLQSCKNVTLRIQIKFCVCTFRRDRHWEHLHILVSEDGFVKSILTGIWNGHSAWTLCTCMVAVRFIMMNFFLLRGKFCTIWRLSWKVLCLKLEKWAKELFVVYFTYALVIKLSKSSKACMVEVIYAALVKI